MRLRPFCLSVPPETKQTLLFILSCVNYFPSTTMSKGKVPKCCFQKIMSVFCQFVEVKWNEITYFK